MHRSTAPMLAASVRPGRGELSADARCLPSAALWRAAGPSAPPPRTRPIGPRRHHPAPTARQEQAGQVHWRHPRRRRSVPEVPDSECVHVSGADADKRHAQVRRSGLTLDGYAEAPDPSGYDAENDAEPGRNLSLREPFGIVVVALVDSPLCAGCSRPGASERVIWHFRMYENGSSEAAPSSLSQSESCIATTISVSGILPEPNQRRTQCKWAGNNPRRKPVVSVDRLACPPCRMQPIR